MADAILLNGSIDPTDGYHYWVESRNYGRDFGPISIFGIGISNESAYTNATENISVDVGGLGGRSYTFTLYHEYSNDAYGLTCAASLYYKGQALTSFSVANGVASNFYYNANGSNDGLIAASLGLTTNSKISILIVAKPLTNNEEIGYTQPTILSSTNENAYAEADGTYFRKKVF